MCKKWDSKIRLGCHKSRCSSGNCLRASNFHTLCQRFQWSCINELWCITVCRWYSNSMSCKEWGKFAANSWRYIKQDRSIYETKHVNFELEKTELMVFRNEKLPIIETVDFKGHRLEASEKCRYLGVLIDRELTYQNQLNKVISKMASAIRSLYLVRYQVPLKTRINLFKSLVLSHLDFSAIFFQNLPSYSIDRINKQINWGIKVCFMKTKYDTARDLLLETKILPAELQITRVSLNRFFNILQQTRNRSNKHFRFLENVPIIVNKQTHNLFLEQKCKSKCSNGSVVRNFIRKWNTLPITIRKET